MGTTISLTNPGSDPIDLTITRNGTTVETVTLAGGASVQRSFSMARGRDVELPGHRAELRHFPQRHPIAAEVAGTRITRDSTGGATDLARTGSMTGQLALVGFLLLAGGGVLLAGSHQRSAMATIGPRRTRRRRTPGSGP